MPILTTMRSSGLPKIAPSRKSALTIVISPSIVILPSSIRIPIKHISCSLRLLKPLMCSLILKRSVSMTRKENSSWRKVCLRMPVSSANISSPLTLRKYLKSSLVQRMSSSTFWMLETENHILSSELNIPPTMKATRFLTWLFKWSAPSLNSTTVAPKKSITTRKFSQPMEKTQRWSVRAEN